MVVRDTPDAVVSLVRERTIVHNCSVFRGEGELGGQYVDAIRSTDPYAGVHYVEALVNPSTGRIEEVLRPSPTRVYEREIINNAGHRITVPVTLSEQNPGARLAVFIVDAMAGHSVIDVIAREEILPEARACLRDSVDALKRAAPRRRAA